ncbi:MAG TPA: ABC transporter permease [Thermoanaerobaculia bacterium]
MNTLLQDIRYGLRTLARAPGFTAIAVATIALGIGANTAIFSVVHAVLLRRLPYPEPARLVVLREEQLRIGKMGVAWPNFLDLRAQSRTLSSLAGYRANEMTISDTREPQVIRIGEVSAALFPLLGARAALGRVFVESDDRPEAPPTVVISDELWRSRFGSDREIVGRTVRLDAVPHTVVGVLPRGFAFFPRRVDLFRPVGLYGAEKVWLNRGNHTGMRVLARLAPGATVAGAGSEVAGIMRQLEKQYPDTNAGQTATVTPLAEELFTDYKPALWTLLGAVGVVLLIACVNVAHLQLARSAGRQRELAIRAALGAGRGRIVRQLVTESVLISGIGGAVGLLLATWAIGPLVRLAPTAIPRLSETRIDPGVLLFTLAVSVATGILFGLTPAISASRPDPQAALGEASRGSTAGRSRQRFRTLLFVSEVALAFVLVIGSGLLIRSLAQLRAVSPGFRPEHVLALDVAVPEARYPTDESREQFYRKAVDALRPLPGVQIASATYCPPLIGKCWGSIYLLSDRPAPAQAELPSAHWNVVEPGYFATLAIPLRRGRAFTDADRADTAKVVIVNETFAKKWWPNGDALGKSVKQGWPKDPTPFREIVGVVGDVRQDGLDVPALPEVFIPWTQNPMPSMTLLVRVNGSPQAVQRAAIAAVRSIDPDQSVSNVMPLTGYLSDSVADRRFTTLLLGFFAALALVLASVGIYGVVAYGVAERRREIGIRTALGARPADVLALVVKGALRLAAVGMVAGAVVALGLSRFLASLLFGIRPTDPATFGGVAILLAAVVLAACVIPARSALRVDPNTALRD